MQLSTATATAASAAHRGFHQRMCALAYGLLSVQCHELEPHASATSPLRAIRIVKLVNRSQQVEQPTIIRSPVPKSGCQVRKIYQAGFTRPMYARATILLFHRFTIDNIFYQ